MIIVKIIGGLGNQLFQYAFSKAIEAKANTRVYHDVEDLNNNYELRKNGLMHFNVKLNSATKEQIESASSVFNKIIFKFSLLFKGLISQKKIKYYSEQKSMLDFGVFSDVTDLYLNGYWQSEKYFSDIEDLIRSEFEIITAPSEGNLKFIKLINNSNSVSLHIRRGDYINNPSAQQIYHTCSLDYYEAAIKYIAKRVEDPVFFVFSDDMTWVKANLHSSFKLVFVDENDGDTAYEDLRLMSKCKHNIIANSTFSWWGAWLNNHLNKIVISPKIWFKNEKKSSENLLPKSWITI
ncbi:alpha-1,2-fucosyltransferase [Mucilaginibacter sp. UR6-11]|uniref:alpha-1,2-fucosyltransferase n=1 Tax=Mucilaginibacter sp. UR6-11 TaxID=1435644 RepID=UPI001E44CF1B|nr:alpha-1,2-fucosyltransferase [Mucilaginibacter sp. UR6-11]MCC8423979.1 alpha-1,2-fucosyltransferase [Mucilaginibacter sp. UR6-11]